MLSLWQHVGKGLCVLIDYNLDSRPECDVDAKITKHHFFNWILEWNVLKIWSFSGTGQYSLWCSQLGKSKPRDAVAQSNLDRIFQKLENGHPRPEPRAHSFRSIVPKPCWAQEFLFGKSRGKKLRCSRSLWHDRLGTAVLVCSRLLSQEKKSKILLDSFFYSLRLITRCSFYSLPCGLFGSG